MVNLFISRLVINDNIPVVEYSPRRLQRNGNIGIFTAEIVKLGLVQPITDIVGEYYNIHISRNIFKENQLIINYKYRFLGGCINLLVSQIRFNRLPIEYQPTSPY